MCKHLTSRLNWNLEVLVFVEGKNLENSKKTPRSKDRTNNKLNPRANHWKRTRVTEVGGKCSHCYTNLLPTNVKMGDCRKKVKLRDCLNLVNDMKIKKGDCKNLLHKSQIGVGGLKGNDFCVVLV